MIIPPSIIDSNADLLLLLLGLLCRVHHNIDVGFVGVIWIVMSWKLDGVATPLQQKVLLIHLTMNRLHNRYIGMSNL